MDSFSYERLGNLAHYFCLHEKDEEMEIAQLLMDDTSYLRKLAHCFCLTESNEVKGAQHTRLDPTGERNEWS